MKKLLDASLNRIRASTRDSPKNQRVFVYFQSSDFSGVIG